VHGWRERSWAGRPPSSRGAPEFFELWGVDPHGLELDARGERRPRHRRGHGRRIDAGQDERLLIEHHESEVGLLAERREQLIECALHDGGQPIQRQIDAVRYLDTVVEELFDLVPRNTYITITSDHGELFGETGNRVTVPDVEMRPM